MRFKVTPVEYKMLCEAHFYVLQNTPEVDCYKLEHLSYIQALQSSKARGEKWLQAKHGRCFIRWVRQRIETELAKPEHCITQTLRWLANEPRRDVIRYSGYGINGYTFHTREHDLRSITQNSGVTVEGESLHVSSAKDKNQFMQTCHTTESLKTYGSLTIHLSR